MTAPPFPPVPPDPSGPLPSGPALDRRLDDIARHRPFGARFRLRGRDLATAELKGAATVRWHAYDLVARRLAPAAPAKDGKQTPYRGHPVFVAQHATATCCRGCLQRWHGIPRGRELSRAEHVYVVDVICPPTRSSATRSTGRRPGWRNAWGAAVSRCTTGS
ncbi:DUF4186 family protein, partial [Streptomyces sp. NPDC004009]